MGNATITVKKVSGSIDQAITLTVSGCKLSKVSSFQWLKFYTLVIYTVCMTKCIQYPHFMQFGVEESY